MVSLLRPFRYRAFRAAKNAKLTNISNTELGTVDLRTRKETESRAECLEFVERFNKTLNNNVTQFAICCHWIYCMKI